MTAVLELRGGRAAELGIAAGDRVELAALGLAPPAAERGNAARRAHGFLVQDLHLVERRDVGHALWTKRFGSEVGTDDAGNVYYEDKKRRAPLGDLQRQ